jgi:VanZ family protein
MLSGNEVSFGLTALEFLDGTRSNLFNTAWGSFPSLYPFLQSIPIQMLGRTLLALRLFSVLAGTLTVAATYVYARFGFGRRVALFSAITLAFLGLHVHFSRLGLNNISDALFAVLLGLTLSTAWRARHPEAFALPGVALGLAQYFYVGSRVFFLLIPLWAVIIVALDRERMRLMVKGMAVLLISTISVFLPLALYFLAHPAEYWAPINRTSVFGHWWTMQTVQFGDPSWWVAGEQILRALLGFVAVPLRQFYVGQPLLMPPLAILFLIGLISLARRVREPDMLWVALWLFGAVAAVALSTDAPAGQRYANASAAVSITVALGLEAILTRTSRLPGWAATTVPRLAPWVLVATLLWQQSQYFRYYSGREILADFNGATVASAASAIQRLPSVRKAYFFISPRLALASHEVVRFLLPGVPSVDVPDNPEWQVAVPGPGTYLFVFLSERRSSFEAISNCFPGGDLSVDETPEGYVLSLVYLVQVPSASLCVNPWLPGPPTDPWRHPTSFRLAPVRMSPVGRSSPSSMPPLQL